MSYKYELEYKIETSRINAEMNLDRYRGTGNQVYLENYYKFQDDCR